MWAEVLNECRSYDLTSINRIIGPRIDLKYESIQIIRCIAVMNLSMIPWWVVWNMIVTFLFSWEYHHPNWGTHIFQRCRVETTKQLPYCILLPYEVGELWRPQCSPSLGIMVFICVYKGNHPCLNYYNLDVVFHVIWIHLCTFIRHYRYTACH